MTTERRISFGDWLVPYDDADAEVTVERRLIDILTAQPGNDMECMNSRCIRAQRNAHVFPHPVYLVSTTKSRVYVCDRLNDAGEPAHVVRYELTNRDQRLIEAHDRYASGELGELRLRVPHDPKGSPRRAAAKQGGRFGAEGGKRYSGDGKKKHDRRPVTARHVGAKARVVAAVGALANDAE